MYKNLLKNIVYEVQSFYSTVLPFPLSLFLYPFKKKLIGSSHFGEVS